MKRTSFCPRKTVAMFSRAVCLGTLAELSSRSPPLEERVGERRPFHTSVHGHLRASRLRIPWDHELCSHTEPDKAGTPNLRVPGHRAWFITTFLFFAIFHSQSWASQLVYEVTSPYHHIRVIDDTGYRFLCFDD